jgi:hypothetical protein
MRRLVFTSKRTHRVFYEVTLLSKIIVSFSENQLKLTEALSGKSADILNDKQGGMHYPTSR